MEILQHLFCGFKLVPVAINSLDRIHAEKIVEAPLNIEVSVLDAQLTFLQCPAALQHCVHDLKIRRRKAQ